MYQLPKNLSQNPIFIAIFQENIGKSLYLSPSQSLNNDKNRS
jgi:hypothetical protein